MTLGPKTLSYVIGTVSIVLISVAFLIRRNDIERIDRSINQRIIAATKVEEELIRTIVQQEVAELVSSHERTPPNMIQTVAIGSETKFSELWNERFAHHLARLKDEKREREKTSTQSYDGVREESSETN